MDNDGTTISTLKNELNALDRTKEDYFAQSKQNKQKLKALFTQIQQLKKERNELTDAVKKLKSERDVLNTELKGKIGDYKKIAPAPKQPQGERRESRVNPAMVRKEIEALEYKIETEALPFNKEQQLMKLIKEKRKSIEGVQEAVAHSTEARELSKNIDVVRKKADEAHSTTKQKADESQAKHEKIIVLLKEFKELQVKQKDLDAKCAEYKEKVHTLNTQLKGSMEHAPRPQHTQQEKREHKPHVDIAGMQQKAEEKLKKGHKLTTEDLLAFQNKK